MSIKIADSLVPKQRNQATREGEVVPAKSDIMNISMPYEGMLVYVTGEKKYYKITGLNADEDGVESYEEFNSGGLAGVFRYMGEVAAVSDLEAKKATAQVGDTWSVTGGNNYSFVAAKYVWNRKGAASTEVSIPDGLITLPNTIAADGIVTIRNNGSVAYGQLSLQSNGKYVILTCTNSGDTLIKTGKVYAWSDGNLYTTDDGADILELSYTASRWNNMGGEGVTMAQVNAAVNASATTINGTITELSESVQDQFDEVDDDIADLNSKYETIKDGCLAEADEANGLIRVKLEGQAGYMFVKAQKLVAPVVNMGSANVDATTDKTKIVITATEGAEIYYIEGDQEPGSAASHVTTRLEYEVEGCLEDESQEVTLSVKAKLNGVWSEKKTQKYTISRKLGALTFDASGNRYTEISTKRTISIAGTTGATIYYREGTSGDWSAYTSAITIEADTTIQAYQKMDEWKDSSVNEKSYEIGKGVIYAGVIDPTASAPATEAQVKSMLGVCQVADLPATYKYTSAGQKKIVVATKSSIANIAHIKDGNNTEYIGDFTATTFTGWKVYTMKNASDQKDIQYTFSK